MTKQAEWGCRQKGKAKGGAIAGLVNNTWYNP